jgi:HK97 family phage portal protein
MGIFSKKKQEIRADTPVSFEDSLLQAMLGNTAVTRAIALQIPTVASAIDLIGNIIASTPIKLYQDKDGATEEVKNDPRTKLLNDETGDTLNAHDFWKAIVCDYYLGKGGYAYINKARGAVASLHYVDETQIAIQKNVDPIFKDYDILVQGKAYKPYDFIKILRNTKDGASGTGIITELSKILEVAYESLSFESALVKKGGNKKGFLKSESKLDQSAIDKLKEAWKSLYANNAENMMVLNKGIEFKESSNTSVEMQLNENKITNSLELCKIFHVSPDTIAGKATESDLQSLAKLAAIPLMYTIQCALNRDLLLEKEKEAFYWAFDTKELLKGNLKERMDSYAVAVDKGIMTRNEARYAEDLPSIDGMNVISMSLADVIFDIKTKTYFTPNTKTVTDTANGTAATTAPKTDPPNPPEPLKGGE